MTAIQEFVLAPEELSFIEESYLIMASITMLHLVLECFMLVKFGWLKLELVDLKLFVFQILDLIVGILIISLVFI